MSLKQWSVIIIRWFFMVLFGLASLGGFATSPVAGFSALALAFLFSPLSEKYLYRKLKKPVPTWGKWVIGVVMFIIFVNALPDTPNNLDQQTATDFVAEQSGIDSASQSAQVLGTESSPVPQASAAATYRVVSVTDGDTFKVDVDGKTETVRLVGVNTPETVDPRKPVQCFGKEASAKLKELLTDESVSLEADSTQSDRDQYGRLLRFAFVKGTDDIGLTLIQAGYAQESLYSATPHKYRDAYVQAQKEAQEGKKGLWADDACPAPTPKPTATPKPTSKPATTPNSNSGSGGATAPAPAANTGGGWSCNCSKTCPQMSSCAEAQFQLNSCGCSARDADDDGVACDADCQ